VGGGLEGKFSVSFGPKPWFKLWIWTWTKLNNSSKLIHVESLNLVIYKIVFCPMAYQSMSSSTASTVDADMSSPKNLQFLMSSLSTLSNLTSLQPNLLMTTPCPTGTTQKKQRGLQEKI
jgi:hypothetical protein